MCICAPPRTPIEGVTVYGRSEWPEYLELCRFFEDRGVLFDHEDVGADTAALEQMRCLSGQVERTVIAIGKRIFVGFMLAELERALP